MIFYRNRLKKNFQFYNDNWNLLYIYSTNECKLSIVFVVTKYFFKYVIRNIFFLTFDYLISIYTCFIW